MNESISLSVGQNLKRIRKELNLKQYAITGGKITRNLISLIENDKTPLYEDNAKIIAETMNIALEEKKLDIIIEPEDILNPARYDAKKRADEYIEELKNFLDEKNFEIKEEKLEEIERFLNHWNLSDKKATIYELIGDLCYYKHDLDNEYKYLTRALDYSFIYPQKKDVYKIVLKLVANYINTGKYEEAIRLGNFGLGSQKEMTDRSKGLFYYNIGLAYSHLNRSDNCLEQVNMAKKYIKNVNDNVAIRIMILEGNSFTKKKEYDKALEAYAHALEMLRDHQNDYEGLYLVYINSIEVFINQKNHSKVTEYLDLIMDVFPHLTKMPHYITNAYLDVSDAYSFLKKYDSCEKYLKIALKSAKNKNEKELQSRILLKMFDFYTERDEDEKIDYVMRELTEYISNIPKDDKAALSAKLILYYLKDKDEEKAKKLAQKIINKGGNV